MSVAVNDFPKFIIPPFSLFVHPAGGTFSLCLLRYHFDLRSNVNLTILFSTAVNFRQNFEKIIAPRAAKSCRPTTDDRFATNSSADRRRSKARRSTTIRE
jgi:hypothetical protein